MNDPVVIHKISGWGKAEKILCGFVSIDFYGYATHWNDNVTCPKCMHKVNLVDHAYKGRMLPYVNR